MTSINLVDSTQPMCQTDPPSKFLVGKRHGDRDVELRLRKILAKMSSGSASDAQQGQSSFMLVPGCTSRAAAPRAAPSSR